MAEADSDLRPAALGLRFAEDKIICEWFDPADLIQRPEPDLKRTGTAPTQRSRPGPGIRNRSAGGWLFAQARLARRRATVVSLGMPIPRPDLDALIWLTGYEQCASGGRIHAARGAKVYCGHSEPLHVRRVLWIDRAALSATQGVTECTECNRLEHMRSGTGPDELIAIYGARQGKNDNALIRHVFALAPEFSPAQDYRIDTTRTQFDDGIGCTTILWRRVTPTTVDTLKDPR